MPEQQNIEWKESWRDEYLKWICGFANAQGGKLYIGCDDSGKVVGVSDSKKLMEDIPNKIRDAMGIVVDVNRLTEGDREYIEIDVPPYPIGISCKGVYHYRSGSTKQVLTGPALEAFLMRKHGATWDHSLKADSLPMPEYTVHPGDIMIKFTGPEDRIVRVNNKVNDRVNVHVNDRESALLNYLAQDPGYTVTQLAAMMNVSRKTIAGYLKALKEKGTIERIGTTRTGYWKIK